MKLLKHIVEFFNQKVILCDLDGTLIVTKSGEKFPKDYDDWKFKPLIRDAIVEYNPRYIFIISNQGGIAEGFVDKAKFDVKFHKIIDEIKTWGNFIVDGIYSESNNSEDYYRKPNIGMVEFFRFDYVDGYDFNLRDALMIGDASGKKGQFSDSDFQCAKNAGIKYCDVDDFIEAMHPCLFCPECYQTLSLYPCPMNEFKSDRLKQVIKKGGKK